MSEDYIRQLEMFHPHSASAFKRSAENALDFAHYTSASNALRILRNNEITPRNAVLMNDFSEINHGAQCLQYAWISKHVKGESAPENGVLSRLLDEIDRFLLPTLERGYDEKLNARKIDTYLLSLVEHDDRVEGTLGRLSMWRAYGGSTNVALVINGNSLGQPYESPLYAAPVLYADKDEFLAFFAEFVEGLRSNIDYLREMGRDDVLANLLGAFHAMAITTKHPGFHEEREWRVVYTPWLATSESVEDAVVEISGIPQRVKRVKLVNDSRLVHELFSAKELMKKIIIGPTQYTWVLYDAFVAELQRAGFEDAHERVVVSNIPIRR